MNVRYRDTVPYLAFPLIAIAALPAAVVTAFPAGAAWGNLPLGALVFLSGLALAAWAAVAILRGGSDPTLAPPDELVETGPYAYSRNPMYVSVIVMVLGEAVALGSAALLGYAALLVPFFQFMITQVEEPQLEAALGDEYEDYRARVPRWLGLPRRPD